MARHPAPLLVNVEQLLEDPQPTRLRRVACEPGCGYVVRVTRKWLANGTPICPTCNQPMTETK